MKVKDMIELLKQQNPEAKVVLANAPANPQMDVSLYRGNVYMVQRRYLDEKIEYPVLERPEDLEYRTIEAVIIY